MSESILTFVHITDTHIGPDPDYGRDEWHHGSREGAEALVQAVNALTFPVDFVLHTGDVASDPDPAAYDRARDILGRLRWPVYYLAGNHDDAGMIQRELMGRSTAEPALYYTFEQRGFQVVVLDSNGPAEPPGGFLVREQLDWLERLCAAQDARPLVVAVHHNPLPAGSPWLDAFMRLENGEALHRALLPAKDRLRGVFFGHVHQSITLHRDGILYQSGPSSWCQYQSWPGSSDTVGDAWAEPGFNVVAMTREQTFVRRWGFRIGT